MGEEHHEHKVHHEHQLHGGMSHLSKKDRRKFFKQQKRDEREGEEGKRGKKKIINYTIAAIILVAIIYFAYGALKFQTPIPTDDPFLGNPNAKLTLIEFGDYNCPFTRQFNNNILPALLEEFGDDIKIVFKDMVTGKHLNSDIASEASECANDQGKYKEFHNLMFARSGDPSRGDIVQVAERAGVDMTSFNRCFDSGKYAPEVREDTKEGRRAKVTVTPTLFINNVQLNGIFELEDYRKAISAELAKNGG